MLNMESVDLGLDIKILGIGSAGTNILSTMKSRGLEEVSYIAINTDLQALNKVDIENKIHIGKNVTGAKGLGSGGDPNVGLKAIEEDQDSIKEYIKDSNIIFLTAGLGGGTGTGGIYKLAQIASESDALVISVVTRPFGFEGKKRSNLAQKGLELLLKYSDSVIVLPNQKLLEKANPNLTFVKAFELSNSVLYQIVKSMINLINTHGVVNVDFADIKTILRKSGLGTIGIGEAEGDDRAEKAAYNAVNSPLIENNIRGARRVLINFSASEIGLVESAKAASYITNQAHPDATIIIGNVIDPEMDDLFRVTLIASDYEECEKIRKNSPSNFLQNTHAASEVKRYYFSDENNLIKRSTESNNNRLKMENFTNSKSSGDYDRELPKFDIPTFLRK
jgi:cell division protein FtsZ